jgi:hypothetical protein
MFRCHSSVDSQLLAAPLCVAGFPISFHPAAIESHGWIPLFLMRQVDCDVLSLRVALQHTLERELAANTAFLIATVGVTGALASPLVDLHPACLDCMCRA